MCHFLLLAHREMWRFLPLALGLVTSPLKPTRGIMKIKPTGVPHGAPEAAPNLAGWNRWFSLT
jgi:hypothetical protein